MADESWAVGGGRAQFVDGEDGDDRGEGGGGGQL